MNAEKAEGSLAIVETMTGTRADTCPWWSFRDPLVADVLHCYAFFESGQLAFAAGRNPPAILVAAIECYHAAVGRARDYLRREREANRDHDARHAQAVREMSRGR